MMIVIAVVVLLVAVAVIQVRRARRNSARQSRLIERGTGTRVETRARRQGLGARAFHAPAQNSFPRRNAEDEPPSQRET